jgi:hypothetical protein
MKNEAVEEYCKNDQAPLARECPDCLDKFIFLAKRYETENSVLKLQNAELVELLRQADDLYTGYGLVCGPIKGFTKYDGAVHQGEWINKVRKITRADAKRSCGHTRFLDVRSRDGRSKNCMDCGVDLT